MAWNWQHPDWPNFHYKQDALEQSLYSYGKYAGKLTGCYSQYPKELQTNAMLDILVAEALNTSDIEGVELNNEEVRSSIKQQLGMDQKLKQRPDLRAQGISSLILESRKNFAKNLTEPNLLHWHELLMQGADPYQIYQIGMWRTDKEPMQIISGAIGKEKIHFEAPPSDLVPKEMSNFIKWFNLSGKNKLPGPIRAAISHLYFESIHPFQDGNGRIGRAIAEKILAQDLEQPLLYSISTTILNNKKEYYDQLSIASSTNNLEITSWIEYFINMLLKAQNDSWKIIEFTLQKAKFWNEYQDKLSARQTLVIKRMMKEGFTGFEGGISAKKYSTITGVSKATATRDLTELLNLNCLTKLPGGGRNTRYEIKLQKINNF